MRPFAHAKALLDRLTVEVGNFHRPQGFQDFVYFFHGRDCTMTLGSYSKLSYEAALQLAFQLWKLGKMRAFRDADPRELRQQIYEMLKDKTLSKAAKVHIRAGAQLWGLLPVNDHEDKLERDARALLHQQAEAAFRAADQHVASGSPQIYLLPSGAALQIRGQY